MFISLTFSRTTGFKRWSNNHPPSNENEAAPIVRVGAVTSSNAAPQDPPHRPWAIPGVGGAF